MQNAIEINKLSKIFKNNQKALNEISFSIREGEIFSLLGPNGAGKSTLINILTTYLSPTSGSVSVLGKPLLENTDFVRQQLSCVAQSNSIDDYLTLYENMKFQGRLYHVDDEALDNRIEELLTTLHLKQYKDTKVSKCSGGIQRRLDIAMSMVSIPKILFLDEPTTAMDIESRHALWDLIKTVNKKYGTTIFLTTHYLEEADQLSDRICIIKEGHEQIIGTPKELKRYLQQNLVKLYFEDLTISTKDKIISEFEKFDFVKNIRISKDTLTIEVTNIQNDYNSILKFGVHNRICFYRAEIVHPSLDDVFLAIANKEEIYERDN